MGLMGHEGGPIGHKPIEDTRQGAGAHRPEERIEQASKGAILSLYSGSDQVQGEYAANSLARFEDRLKQVQASYPDLNLSYFDTNKTIKMVRLRRTSQ